MYLPVMGGVLASVSTTEASSTNDLDSLSVPVDSCGWKSPMIVPDFDVNSAMLEFKWSVETAVTQSIKHT